MKFLSGSNFSRRRSKIILMLFLVLSFASARGLAQMTHEKAPAISERIFFGGNFGLQFGTVTNIQIAPIVGFWLRPRIAVAVGPEYQYYKDPYYKTNIYDYNFSNYKFNLLVFQ